MVPLAVLALVWQVWSVADRKPSTFLVSYWYVTWDHGFVRRGLLGEINQLFFGDDLLNGALLLSRIVAGLSAATVAVVVFLLFRRGTALAVGVGWVLLISPFTIKGLINFARPDQLAVPMMLLIGLVWWRRPQRPVVPLFLLGLGFAVVVLAHEAVVLMYAPWILLLIVHFSRHARWPVLVGRVAAFFAVPALFTLAVLDRGAATKKQVKLFKEDAEPTLPKGNNMLNYIGDSTSDSMEMVLRFGVDNMIGMIVVGLALWLLHLLAMRLVPGMPLLPSRPVTLVLVGVVLPAFAVQSILAIDWQRWFALWMGMAVLTYGIVLIASPRPSRWGPPPQVTGEDARWSTTRIIGLVCCCVLLTLVPISSANNKLPCSWDYLIRETPFPFQRVGDLVTGDEHTYKVIKCKDKD